MSTGGLELTKYINPDLTWKTVAKGYRSSLRRTKKPATRKSDVGVELSDEVSRKADVVSVSDNEKNGVAVLGHHFSEEVEHVPIKKRRIITQPPALTTQSQSSYFEVTEPSSTGKKRHKATDASKITKFTGRISGVNDRICDFGEDFSGIEILAAVACNNSLFNHGDHGGESSPREESLQEAVGSSTSVVPSEETIASSNDPANADKFEAPLPEDSPAAIFHKSPSTKDTGKMELTTSLQDERLLWDLNAVPCDNLCADCQADAQHSISVGQMLQDIGSNEVPGEPKDSRKEPLDGLVTLEVHVDDPSSTDSKGLAGWPSRLSADQVEAESVLHRKCNNFPTLTSGIAQERSMYDVADVKESCEIIDTDDSSRAGISVKNEGTSASGLTVNRNTEVYCADTQAVQFSSIKSVLIDRCHAASSHLPELEGVSCDIGTTILNEEGEESMRTSSLHEDLKSSQSMIQGQDASGDHHFSPNNGDVSASSESGVEGQHVVAVDVKKQEIGVSGANTAGVESPEAIGSEELVQKSCIDSISTPGEARKGHDNRLVGSLGKVATEDPSDESYGSDVYQADKIEMSVAKNSVELQAGYDSQFEDGELRESDTGYYWDEDEEEIEHVDYGSECDEKTPYGFGAEEMRVERGSSPGSDSASKKVESCGTGGAARDGSVSPKTRIADVTTVKDFPAVVAGSRESDGELLSSVKVPDASHRRDVILNSRDDGIYDLLSRDARAATSKKFIGRDRVASHMRGRSPGGSRCVNLSAGYWESEGQYLPTYHGAYSSRPTRPKRAIGNHGYTMDSEHVASEMTRFGGFDRRNRKPFNYSDSHNRYEHNMRRRSPVNRDYVDIHNGRLPVGEVSPPRNRFGRSQQGFGRGIREEYHKRLPLENIGYLNRVSHRLARRERSISPLDRVRLHYATAYRESQSRSRSRSPAAYIPRERCERSRIRSRSPNFRSDARMERPRLPFHKHFKVGYEEGFFSPTKSNFSSQHNSRWFDDRKGASDSYRGRKSSARMFQQSQRFETVHSFRRLNSDELFRPSMQSRQFLDKGVAGREGDYEDGDDDRNKRGSRHEVAYRARRYDTDGAVQRFRRNGQDSFVGKDSLDSDDCNRVTDRSRDALRRASEE